MPNILEKFDSKSLEHISQCARIITDQQKILAQYGLVVKLNLINSPATAHNFNGHQPYTTNEPNAYNFSAPQPPHASGLPSFSQVRPSQTRYTQPNSVLNGTPNPVGLQLEIESLKSRLNKATSELSSTQEKNRKLLVNMNMFKNDLEQCRTQLANEINENNQLYEKIKELEEARFTANAHNTMLKLETDQWKKAAKTVASVFVKGADICSMAQKIESIVLYYNNRATKRMSLGKIRKALDDCRMVTRLDPGFRKVCITAGNCHLVLGEFDDALKNYKMCLDSAMVFLDRKLIIEASDGLQNIEKVVNFINHSDEILQHKSIESATNALEFITEALSISRYSERLLKMKGEALFMLHKYEEVVQICEETLVFAEMNCATSADYNYMSDDDDDDDDDQKQPLKLWRWRLMSRCYFHMAKFDLALSILEKYELLAPSETKTEGAAYPSAATIRDLLNCKNAGNIAFSGRDYKKAVKHYSDAIKRSIESRHFTAICLCNRAAAHKAMDKVIDAIADCNLAIAFDGVFIKAISRRAILYEQIGDYDEASLDFQRLISLLETRDDKKDVEDLAEYRKRLSSLNIKKEEQTSLNSYVILGVKESASGSDINRAYRKAALIHHPDKVTNLIARSERGTDGDDWEEILTSIDKDANKVFVKIKDAYDVLSRHQQVKDNFG